MRRIVQKIMLWGGMFLGIMMMQDYVFQEAGKKWIANEILQWSQRMIRGEEIGEKAKSMQLEVLKQDPAYSEFVAEQQMRTEMAYWLLMEKEGEEAVEEGEQLVKQSIEQEKPEDALPVAGKVYRLEQLMDYDFLMKNFYNVHASTTATREEMNAGALLSLDLALQKEKEPQILIYHTHSQETYADYSSQNQEATVVGVGEYLTELLEKKGYRVIHDTSVYDLIDGELDRNHAYNHALDGISGILQRYPSIQVILDLHRDGVREDLHMVSEVNGKPTAPIMFFNGMSQTPDGAIEYLQNPYKKENLAFSLQMQLEAAAYYPGLTRKIYLKGLRYNLHLRARSALIEVGAQTNTYQEARNAMEPLAEILDMVLNGDFLLQGLIKNDKILR